MKVRITTEYITLGQFLKFAGIIGNGGEAKEFLLNNKVVINGESDQRRGRKIRIGDKVKIQNKTYEVIGNDS